VNLADPAERAVFIGLGAFLLVVLVLAMVLGRRDARFIRKRRRSLGMVTGSADPIIDALEAWHLSNVLYPETLEALLPEYIFRIPPPPLPSQGRWHYVVLRHGGVYELRVPLTEGFHPDGAELWTYLAYRPDRNYPNAVIPARILGRLGKWALYGA